MIELEHSHHPTPIQTTLLENFEKWSGVSISKLDISGAVFTVLLLVANSLLSCSSSGLELAAAFFPIFSFTFHRFNPLFTYGFLHFFITPTLGHFFLSWLFFGCTDFKSCFPSSLTILFTSLLGLDLATFNLLLSCSWSAFAWQLLSWLGFLSLGISLENWIAQIGHHVLSWDVLCDDHKYYAVVKAWTIALTL